MRHIVPSVGLLVVAAAMGLSSCASVHSPGRAMSSESGRG
jgi:hypothetical protein